MWLPESHEVLHNKEALIFPVKNIDRANLHTLPAFADPDTVVHIDFHTYKLTHPLNLSHSQEFTFDLFVFLEFICRTFIFNGAIFYDVSVFGYVQCEFYILLRQ